MKNLSRATRGYIYGLAGVIIFGLTLPATHLAVSELPATFVGLGRSVVAAVLAVLYLAVTRAKLPSRRQFTMLAAVPLGIVFGFPFLSAVAMKTAPASHGGVVLGILPLATAAAAVIFARERPSLAFWLWGIAGAAGVSAFALLDGGVEIYKADGLLFLAVLAAAFGYAVSGNLSRTMPALDVISWALVIALPVNIIVVYLAVDNVNWHAPLSAWAAFAYVAVFSQFLGFYFWNRGLALGGVSHVGQIQLFQIFVTLAGSAILLGETIKPVTIIFALFTVLAVYTNGHSF